MPWEKSFDEDVVLGRAMEAFWAHGYAATSMQDLVARMGIGRASIYATYGNKRSLFIKALKRYDSRHRHDWTERLAASHGPRDAILTAFREVVDSVLGERRRDGCLLVNTALDLSPHDPEVSGLVAGSLEAMERFFRERIAAGQEAGEIPAAVAPEDTARALLALLIGLRVFGRSRPEPALLSAVVRQAEALLE